MREYIDECDIANTAMMVASANKGAILIVEGLTDRRLYGKFIDRDVEIVVAYSKHNVEGSLRRLKDERRFSRAVGIIDSDLDRLYDRTVPPPVFVTDTRDSESMMLKSNALEDVISEYSDPDRIEEYEKEFGPVRDAVLRSAYPLGLLMYVSEKNGLKLSFKNLDFETFISRRTMGCDRRRMVDEVIYNSVDCTRSARTILSLLEKEKEYDPWLVCRGHDITAILAIGLKYIFGGDNTRYLNGSSLAGSFRLAYGRSDFEDTDLYKDSRTWSSEKGLTLWLTR